LEDAAALLILQFREKGIRFEKNIQPEMPPVRGNKEALRSAVQNLLANAIIHGGSGKYIRLAACEQGPSSSRELCIKVQDKGMGLSRKDLPHIFEPFYRGEYALEEQVPGTGLGLSLVKRIIEAHGGKVAVESSPGKGSTFTLSIPYGGLHPRLDSIHKDSP
ncbi:MAG: HAMP domain-containing sensor histidine kinase, partial [Spirochaetota bacterium]